MVELYLTQAVVAVTVWLNADRTCCEQIASDSPELL